MFLMVMILRPIVIFLKIRAVRSGVQRFKNHRRRKRQKLIRPSTLEEISEIASRKGYVSPSPSKNSPTPE